MSTATVLLLIMFVVLQVADALATTWLITRYGVEFESNPLMRWVLRRWGAMGLWVVKGIVVGGAVAIAACLDDRRAVAVLSGVVLIYALSVALPYVCAVRALIDSD